MSSNDSKLRELFATLVDHLRNRNVEEAKRLVTDRPELLDYVDDCGRLALHWACSCGTLPFVQMIFAGENAENIDQLINRVDDMGWTLLMIASSAGHLSVVNYLLSFVNCDVNAKNKNGQTALHYACSKDHAAIARVLIDHDADVNATDRYGATPLHRAAAQGRDAIVSMLVSTHGIRLDMMDSEGNTPLHCAVEDQNETSALLLVRNGADIDRQNRAQLTPIDLAKNAELKQKLRVAANG